MMNIRLMREEDLFQVTSLHDVLFKQSFNFEDYVQEKMFHYGIVIEIDHQIVGYLVGQIIFEMSDLYYVAVNPDYRSKGYGRLLVEQFIQDACKNEGDTAMFDFTGHPLASLHVFEYLKDGHKA